MPAKCANPTCSATFRYLHEGKLYLMEEAGAAHQADGSSDDEFSCRSHSLRYFWLCASCSPNMRVIVEQGSGATVVPLPRDGFDAVRGGEHVHLRS